MATTPSDLAIARAGSDTGPTVVLLHGFMDSGAAWADVIRRWKGYRLVVPDARGHGLSPRLTPEQAKPTSAPVMIEDAVALVESLAAQSDSPIALVGHSMGAGVAAAVATQVPDRVTAIVLEDPAWMPLERARAWKDAHVAQDWAQEFRDDFDSAVAAAQVEHPGWRSSFLPFWANAKTQIDPLLRHTGQVVARTSWTDLAAALTVPALLVTGDQPDNTVNAESLELLAASGAKTVEVAQVSGAGHYVRLDNPDGYHAAVDPFLTRHLGA